MAVTISGPRIFENLDASLEAIQAGPAAFVVLEVNEGQERRIAVSLLRQLTQRRGFLELTFNPDALDIRAFLAATADREREVVFLFGLANLGPVDRQRAWTCLNMAREAIRASHRTFVLFVAIPHADEFPLHAPDLRACVTAHFRLVLPVLVPTVKDPLTEKPLPEVERLLRQAAYYESRMAEPVVVPESRAALLRDYAHLLENTGDLNRSDALRAEADRLAGVQADGSPWILQEYLEGVLKETNVIRISDLAVQVGQQILEIAFDDIYVPLRLLRAPMRQPLRLAEVGHTEATGKFASGILYTWNVRQAEKGRQPDAQGNDCSTVGKEAEENGRYPSELLATREEGESEPITTEEALGLGSVVVLGDPGTGKSTFLRWMARTAAKALLGQLDSSSPPAMTAALKDRVPLLVHARLLAERLPATTEDPEVILATACARTGAAKRFLQDRLRSGRCLVLVDGLDEIPALEVRERVRSVLGMLAARPAGNCILATSRIVGYDLVRLGSSFEQVQLRELDDEGVRQFISQWYRTIAKVSLSFGDESPDQRAEVLLDAIARNPGIRRIAGNPLLLTITALIHWRGGRLPEKRAAVYEAATRTLLDNWLARRPWVKLNADEMISVLSKVAFDMHERGESGLIPESRLRELFCAKLAEARFTSAETIKEEVHHLLATLSQHSGLFLERGRGGDGESQYGFLHLTFQEYLAALHLFQRWTEWVAAQVGTRRTAAQSGANPIHGYLFEQRWQEVILLAASKASETNEALAGTFVRGVLTYGDRYETLLRRALLLAGRILADDVRVDRGTAENICGSLIDLLTKSELQFQKEVLSGILVRHAGTVYASLLREKLLSVMGAIDSNGLWAVARAFPELGDHRALDPLLGRLGDPNGDVRAAATWALGRLKDPRALDPLLERLHDKESWVRDAAVRSLGILGDPVALEPILEALGDADEDVSFGAAIALGNMGDPWVVEPLLKRLDGDNLRVQLASAIALGMLGDPRAIEPLMERLHDEHEWVRGSAATALGELGDPRALEPLLELLRDRGLGVQEAAARALGELRDPRALEPLLELLRDRGLGVQEAAARALGELRDPRAIDSLAGLLQDGDRDVRAQAARSLAMLGDPRALKPLLDQLKDESPRVRSEAASALRMLGDPRALKPLVEGLEDEDSGVRFRAALAIGALKDTRALKALSKIALRREPGGGKKEAREALFILLWPGVVI